jgi:prepilin-type N-terminal cleavage/methylation domain-containing protein
MMKIKCMKSNSGFTLVEVLVSVGILLVFLPFAASMLTNSQLLASYSKHKIQAAYVAQQLIETQRQLISSYFIPTSLSAGQSKTISGFVMLDNKGNYTNTTCTNAYIPCGIALITVTPTVYTNSNGTSVTSTNVDHFVVQISWEEQILNIQVPMTETYAEDIANDPMLN